MEKTYTAARIRTEDHKETLARLWKDNLAPDDVTDALAARRMRWFHDENPAGPARTWMGYHGKDQEIIGCASFYPRNLRVAGRARTAGILGDFAVTKSHRIAGAAMSIQREISRTWREPGIDFLFAFPNRASFPIFQRAGYKKIGEASMWVKPLSSAYKLRELYGAAEDERRAIAAPLVQRALQLAAGAVPSARWRALWDAGDPDTPPAPLPRAVAEAADAFFLRAAEAPDSFPIRAAAGAIDLALKAKDAGLRLARRRPVDTEIRDAADERFDALWARARPPFIVGEQTAAYLNWRYTGPASAPFRFFCLVDRADRRLLGFAVFSLRRNKVDIADLFCEDFDATLDLLLLELCDAMRHKGHVAVGLVFVGPALVGERLRSIGFFPRPLPKAVGSRWLIAHLDAAVPEDLRREVLDGERWFMPDGELDA